MLRIDSAATTGTARETKLAALRQARKAGEDSGRAEYSLQGPLDDVDGERLNCWPVSGLSRQSISVQTGAIRPIATRHSRHIHGT